MVDPSGNYVKVRHREDRKLKLTTRLSTIAVDGCKQLVCHSITIEVPES